MSSQPQTIEGEVVETAIVPINTSEAIALQPVMNLELAKERLAEFQQFVREYLREGEDFGTIPGTPKPTLYKPGADKLCELYGLADDYTIEDKVEDFDRGLFDYTIKCYLSNRRNGALVSVGMGSCNSFEGKYRWRDSQRVCLICNKPTIIKGKVEYGGGWICFVKKGGCGEKYLDNDPRIEGQVVGRVQNEDIATLKNTILKMAKKRAKVDATLAATRSSGIFTQDIEDIGIGDPPPDHPTSTNPTPQAKGQAKTPAKVEDWKLEGDQLSVHVYDVQKRNGKKGEFVALKHNGKVKGKDLAFCFHKFLFELLLTTAGTRVRLLIEANDEFVTIQEVIQVGEQAYMNGEPVADAPEQNAHGVTATDQDLPF
jgi:hypothetical protein